MAKQITVDEATNMALKNNLLIQSAQLNVESYSKLKKSFFELPKTELSYQFGQFNSNNKDNSFEIAQSIPFPTYYSARSGLYNAEYKNSQLKQQKSANEIKAQVYMLYYQLQYLKKAKVKILQLDSIYNDFVVVATLRFNTGDDRQYFEHPPCRFSYRSSARGATQTR